MILSLSNDRSVCGHTKKIDTYQYVNGKVILLNNISDHLVNRWNPEKNGKKTHRLQMIQEEPLSIRVQGQPYSVVMRTPGNELDLVAGFCLTEGLVDTRDDLATLAFCDGDDTNVVTVTLSESRKDKIESLLDRRGFISQTSCGLCGKELVEDLYANIRPVENESCFDATRIHLLLEDLPDIQPLFRHTKAAHASAVYNADYELLAVAEDVGRHNAMDKTIGKLFLENQIPQAAFVVLSSRASFELVQKAARARIPVIVTMSRPTALAVRLAIGLKITLACADREGGLYIFSEAQRLEG